MNEKEVRDRVDILHSKNVEENVKIEGSRKRLHFLGPMN